MSLALLKANWDVRGQDYLQGFVPLVAESTRLLAAPAVSLQAIQEKLRDEFGLVIPQGVVRSILKRVAKAGYVRTSNGIYIPDTSKLDNLDFHSTQQRVVAMHEDLIEGLATFCRDTFDVRWTTKEAEASLHQYIEEHQTLALTQVSNDVMTPPPIPSAHNSRFIVASFIHHLHETHSSRFDYLISIVQGHMLANAIFLPEPQQARRRFRQTEVYFDTSFLIHALGYSGSAYQEPARELLDLLYKSGAEPSCFRHTVEEIRGILEACTHLIEQPKGVTGPIVDTLEHFLQQGRTRSDIQLLSVRLEKSLEALRVRIAEVPAYTRYKYVIDEDDLKKALADAIDYRNERALERDVASIAAIIRLRRGQETIYVEECRALFVSDNWRLAKVCHQLYSGHIAEGSVAICLPSDALTNLLWLKSPNSAPELPKKRIIADCYAATQPDGRIWQRYLAELDALQANGEVDVDDYYLFRYSMEAKATLMELTLGAEEAFTEATVPELLERFNRRAQDSVREEFTAKLEEGRQAHEGALSELAAERHQLAAAQEQEQARDDRLAYKANRFAHRVCLVIEVIFAVCLLCAAIYPAVGDSTKALAPLLRYGISAVLLLSVALGLLHAVFGTTVRGIGRSAEIWLARWVLRRLRNLAGS